MDIIQQIGSYAGLAAVVGLAVLAGLYFSQARDVKRLREWAGRAPDRPGAPVAPPRVVPRATPTPPASAQGQAPPAPPGVPSKPTPPPAVPARAAAAAPPAVSQDTMAHPPPVPKPSPVLAPPGLGGHFAREAQLASRDDVAEGQPPEGEGPAEEEELDHDDLRDDDLRDEELEGDEELVSDDDEMLEGDEPEDGEDADGAVEGGTGTRGPGEGAAVTPPPAPARVPPRPAPARPVPPPPITASRQPLPARPVPPRRSAQGAILPPYEQSRPGGAGSSQGRDRPRPRRGPALAVGGAALLLAAVAFGVLQLTGGDDGAKKPAERPTPSAGSGSATPPAAKPGANAAIVPGEVTVSVLNGTTVGGLAAQLGDRLKGQGFRLGKLTNNTDQQRAESVVLFAPGAEDEAKDVGRRLKIDQREPVDPDSQARAGDASVVVIAGADQSK